jgi:hypothetical protein
MILIKIKVLQLELNKIDPTNLNGKSIKLPLLKS